ncbi:TIR domain-containing protein [bacterium SCSIO 12696]|nr:TIR domain-containing protein [bacterium SCSIO 12696]
MDNDKKLPGYAAFISHSSKDMEKAYEICESLEERGLKCWIAPRDIRPGKAYAEEIVYGVQQSRCLVVLLSESANNSINVAAEAEEARKSGKPIFPVRIEDVQPSSKLSFYVSVTQWIDAWSGSLLDHVDHLAKEIHESKGGDYSSDLKSLSTLDKSLRFAQRNMIALIAVLLIGLLGITLFSSKDTQSGADSLKALGLDSIPSKAKDIDKDDLTLSTFMHKDMELGVSIQPVYHPKLWKELERSTYILKFTDGSELEEFSQTAYFNTHTPIKLKGPAEFVDVKIKTQKGVVIGPFKYNLNFDQLQKNLQKQKDLLNASLTKQNEEWEEKRRQDRLQRTKERFSNGRILWCSSYFGNFSLCRLNVGSDAKVKNLFKSIYFHTKNKTIELPLESDQKNTDILFLDSINGNQLEFVISTPLNELSYSALYTDNSVSEHHDANTNHQNFRKVAVFELEGLAQNSPRLFINSEPGGGYYRKHSTWHLFPFVSAAKEISWTIHEGGINKFTKQRSGEFTANHIPADSLGVTYDGSEGPNIKLTVIDVNNNKNEYEYKVNWQKWLPLAASYSINFENQHFIRCNKSKVHNTNVEYSVCSIDLTEPVEHVFSKMEWGFDPKNLKDFSGYNLEKEYRALESRVSDYMDEVQRNEQLDEKSKKRRFRHMPQTMNKLKVGWIDRPYAYQKRREVLLVQEMPQAVYFRFSLIDGSETPVFRIMNE